MINRVKNWLGIEGLKIELDLPDKIGTSEIYGILRFSSMREQVIEKLEFLLVETYSRGRGKEKRIDDKTLSIIKRDVHLIIEPGKDFAYPFQLPYELPLSNVDKLSHYAVLKPLSAGLKWAHGVKSTYFLQVTASVRGNMLRPQVKRELSFA